MRSIRFIWLPPATRPRTADPRPSGRSPEAASEKCVLLRRAGQGRSSHRDHLSREPGHARNAALPASRRSSRSRIKPPRRLGSLAYGAPLVPRGDPTKDQSSVECDDLETRGCKAAVKGQSSSEALRSPLGLTGETLQVVLR